MKKENFEEDLYDLVSSILNNVTDDFSFMEVSDLKLNKLMWNINIYNIYNNYGYYSITRVNKHDGVVVNKLIITERRFSNREGKTRELEIKNIKLNKFVKELNLDLLAFIDKQVDFLHNYLKKHKINNSVIIDEDTDESN